MFWSKLKEKVNKEGYIKPAIFETEWNRWYILMIFRSEADFCGKELAEERASDEPREDYIRLLEKEVKTCRTIVREREFWGRVAPINPFPWFWKKLFGK